MKSFAELTLEIERLKAENEELRKEAEMLFKTLDFYTSATRIPFCAIVEAYENNTTAMSAYIKYMTPAIDAVNEYIKKHPEALSLLPGYERER